MYNTVRSIAAVALTILLPSANAFWRLECDGSVGTARIDPLMDFDGLSDHIHTIKGGSGKFIHPESLLFFSFLFLVGRKSFYQDFVPLRLHFCHMDIPQK